MLVTTPNLEAPDEFLEALIDAHLDLLVAQSHALNARLVLLLANHIGRHAVLRAALDAARANTLETLPTGSGERRDEAQGRATGDARGQAEKGPQAEASAARMGSTSAQGHSSIFGVTPYSVSWRNQK